MVVIDELTFTDAEIDAAIKKFAIAVDPEDIPRSDWWQITHAASDGNDKKTKKVLNQSLKILDKAPRGKVAEAIENGDIASALALFDWQAYEEELAEGLFEVFTDIALQSGADTALEVGKGLDFDEELIAANLELGANTAAKRVTQNTRKGMSDFLNKLMRSGSMSPKQTQKSLFELIGLDSQQMSAAANAIVSDREGGSTLKQVADKIAKLRGDKLATRFENIARFENLNVAQAAQEDAIQQHLDVRAIKNVIKIWVVVPDDSLCPICNRLRGQKRQQGDNFNDPLTGLQYVGPPAHQRCRCGLKYVEARAATNVGVRIVDVRTPPDSVEVPSTAPRPRRRSAIGKVGVFEVDIFESSEPAEPRGFHQAGKHDQSAHGKGGGKGASPKGRKGRKKFEGSIAVAASDGQRGILAQKQEYADNQKGAIGLVVKDRAALINGDAMVDSGGSMQARETPTSDVEKNFKGHEREHQTNQKALNAERISGRMKGDMAELSDDEMADVATELTVQAGAGDHFARKVRPVDAVERGGVLPDSPAGVQTDNGQTVFNKNGKPATEADFDRMSAEGGPPKAINVANPGGLGTKRVLVSQREANENDTASALVGMHAKTADNGFPPATAVQDSVKKKFGNEFGTPSDSYKENDGKLTGADAFRKKTGGKMGVAVDSYVDAVYAETQSTLKDAGVESLVLHRGTTRANTTLGGEKTYKMNPVSSWSRSNRTANTFGAGETVLTATIPAKRIFSIASTGPGSFLEEEFIVVGGTIEAHGEEAFGKF